jgi:hypothetical protein
MLASQREAEVVFSCSHLIEDESILRSHPAQPPIPLSDAGIGATYIGPSRYRLDPAATYEPIGAVYAPISLYYFQSARDIDNMCAS